VSGMPAFDGSSNIWIAFPGAGSIAAFGTGHRAPAYRFFNGEIQMRGLLVATGSISAGVAVGVMPAGARPGAIELFGSQSVSGSIRLDVNPDGTVALPANAITAGTWFSLTSVHYVPGP
jgi:hypothetical protein